MVLMDEKSVKINKISDFVWEINGDEQNSMNTSVKIFANDYIISNMQRDRTLRQAINAASLPTIVGSMLVMPDGHEGYGFPVGGVAAFPATKGIISPGAIGFDINCLHKDSRVLNRFGAWERICDMSSASVRIYDKVKRGATSAHVLLAMKKKHSGKILKIRTRHGREIAATSDHPMLTDAGMVNAGKLAPGGRIVVTGFDGVEFSNPQSVVIAGAAAIERTMESLRITDAGNARRQVLAHLRRLGFIDLQLNDPKVPVLLKVIGLVMGDGTIPRTTLVTAIYGKKEDLENVAADLSSIGVRSRIYSRRKNCSVTTRYGTSVFANEEYSLHIPARAFGVLMATLGVPLGNKATQAYAVPDWIKKAEKWQKRLFLAAYFGAEMTKPLTNNGYNFSEPAVSVNKLKALSENAVEFLSDLKEMLQSFSVECSPISEVDGYAYEGKNGKTTGHRLAVLSNADNLLRFFSTVSYEYNRSKESLASLAAIYLSGLMARKTSRDRLRSIAISMHNSGAATSEIVSSLDPTGENVGFIEHSVWGRSGSARIWKLERFDEFISASHAGGSFAFDEIEEITPEPYDDYVYDITVDDLNHDFIANGMVVSNCGVRLVRTNLSFDEAKPKLDKLMDALFSNVPSGVGSKAKKGFTRSELERVAVEGASQAIRQGFGSQDDLERLEENGCMEGADPSKVSDLAKKRGLSQLGTLGAGNHFLEVQRVGSIMDEKKAKAFGLFENQVVVMVHSGSRGYGHQVCSDYLRVLNDYNAKNNIRLVDPELSYAYTESKEADDYLKAMKSAVNFAFANRQVMTDSIRKSFEQVFAKSWDELGMQIVYDVAHNIAKEEEHSVNGKRQKLIVHRKGATRAFGPGRSEIPKIYREYGQPVLIPGSMSTASYVLAGLEGSMEQSFGSSCHGSGRLMSRHQAIREIPASKTIGMMHDKHIELRVRDRKLVSEESEQAYKNVDDVVASVEGAGISNIVAKLLPLGVAKG
jgi:tRNA-splicing ligase RtcB